MTRSSVVSCGGCHGRCCTAYVVPVNGADIWRIARTQHLAPAQFVWCDDEEEPTPTGVLLRPGEATYMLALRHHQPRQSQRICMFLNQLPGGDGLCSIYADRPLVCRAYPMYLRKGRVIPRDDMLCPAGSWEDIEAIQTSWRALLVAQRQAWEDYALVVSAWNGAIRSQPSAIGATLARYLDYLLLAYDLVSDRPLETAVGELHALAVNIIGA